MEIKSFKNAKQREVLLPRLYPVSLLESSHNIVASLNFYRKHRKRQVGGIISKTRDSCPSETTYLFFVRITLLIVGVYL